ncbi:MAG: 4-hydroxy-tetrahydrodipicolinate synthase [Afipia sp.]|nr:MAG: 4-hydroxy-tetrahydrodipicolinate synthase [Afipia sp.]
MTYFRTHLRGLWLPLITPFRNGELDEVSLRRLVRHYGSLPIDGMILAATTGEGLTLAPDETARLVTIVRDEVSGIREELPVCLGLSGSDTRELLDTLERTAAWPIDGYLISCPYYSRPTQTGMIRHFSALADQATHPVMIYNIPYRTGVNLGNDAMLQLAEHPNIAGLKDCCAIRAQSIELQRRRPARFAVLSGEDAHTYDALVDGADGAILASAHIETNAFASVIQLLTSGNHDAALRRWQAVSHLTKLLFSEPSPAPIKHWLWRTGLIDSPELRLPMTEVSPELAMQLDREIAARANAAATATTAVHSRSH